METYPKTLLIVLYLRLDGGNQPFLTHFLHFYPILATNFTQTQKNRLFITSG